MIFTEFRFILFFILVAGIYWTLQNNKARKFWLLICSYVFYAAWDWRFLSLIIASTVVDYIVSLMLSKPIAEKYRKLWLIVSLCSNLGLLGFFKYFNFFTESAISLFTFLGIPAGFNTINIVLPVGISFYTFQTMSYSIDVYLRKLKPVSSPLDLALYVSFFPQLVAGPIVRAADFLPQLLRPRKITAVSIKSCLLLFLIGFFKKACISDNLAPFIDDYFSAPELYTSISAWLGVVSYAIQIYCDFSGYSDMAIACAGLLGYEFCENFNYPYFSDSVANFWRNWHISLSTWLRDYLYIPLGGSRVKTVNIYRNLMITMTLGGLWHGAGWNFVIWGVMHGLALVTHRLFTNILKQNHLEKLRAWSLIGPLMTFYFICITWIFFRASDFSTAMTVVKSFVFWQSSGTQQLSYILGYLIICLGIIHWVGHKKVFSGFWDKLSTPVFIGLYSFLLPFVLACMSTSYNAFIYFQF